MEKLQLNPRLGTPDLLDKAVQIFTRISQWKSEEVWLCEQNHPVKLISARVAVGQSKTAPQTFINYLDQDIFSKINLVWPNGQSQTVEVLLLSEVPYRHFIDSYPLGIVPIEAKNPATEPATPVAEPATPVAESATEPATPVAEPAAETATPGAEQDKESATQTVTETETPGNPSEIAEEAQVPYWQKLLAKNPKINSETLPKAAKLFGQISQWSYSCSITTTWDPGANKYQYRLHNATVYPNTDRKSADLPSFMNYLDQDIFSQIFVHGKKTVQQLLDECESFDQPQQSVLQHCEIIEFTVHTVGKQFREWIDGKTFGGIHFKWNTMGSGDLVKDVWPNTKDPIFRCPRYMIDRFIRALSEASYNYSQTLDDLILQIVGTSKFATFGPRLEFKGEKPGFCLEGPDPKIYYAEQVPWKELAERKVQVKL